MGLVDQGVCCMHVQITRQEFISLTFLALGATLGMTYAIDEATTPLPGQSKVKVTLSQLYMLRKS